jgi:type IX secretion system PorP/SprF family membrane protein
MKCRKHIGILFLLFLSNLAYAQDIHFSQYFNTLTTLNPAFAGIINGDFRISTSYKDQWRSISSPYKTIFASFDLAIKKGGSRYGYWGVGINFLNDKAGTSQMQLNQIGLTIAYHLKINRHDELSIGTTPMFVQRSITVEDLKWGSQFDGNNYNSTIQSGEVFANTSKNSFDLNTTPTFQLLPHPHPNPPPEGEGAFT